MRISQSTHRVTNNTDEMKLGTSKGFTQYLALLSVGLIWSD